MTASNGKRIVQHGDAQLTFYHYKEPLQAIAKGQGYGYYGAVLATLDGTQIQCHVCGKLFADVSRHVLLAHQLSSTQYKTQFQLAKKTALVSESARLNRRQVMWKLLHTRPELYAKWKANWALGKANRRRHPQQPRLALETKNKRGTCPQQLLEKILEVKRQLKHVPSLAEFVEACGTQRYKHLIFTVYGSWLNALKACKLTAKINTSPGFKRRYQRDELIDLLQLFTTENNRLPTYTDCRRGLLPSGEVFARMFGTWEQAREEAKLYHLVDHTIEQQRISERRKLQLLSNGAHQPAVLAEQSA